MMALNLLEKPKEIYRKTGINTVFSDIYGAFDHFFSHDGAALASLTAFSVLCAMFPFLVVIVAVTAVIGGEELRLALIHNISLILPEHIVGYLEPEINKVIQQQSGSVFTFGFAALLVTITGAVESIRTSINRAYGWQDDRFFIYRRLGALLYAITGGALFILVVAVLLAAPASWELLQYYIPQMARFQLIYEITRPTCALFLLLALLYSCHMVLPAKSLNWKFITPGIVFTLVAWFLAGRLFSWYLETFAPYARIYAGLAGVMATLIFLYIISLILILGAEFNATRWYRINKQPRPNN